MNKYARDVVLSHFAVGDEFTVNDVIDVCLDRVPRWCPTRQSVAHTLMRLGQFKLMRQKPSRECGRKAVSVWRRVA